MEKSDAAVIVENVFKRFCEIHPDHTFTKDNISFDVLEREFFLERLCEITQQHSIEGADLDDAEVRRNFSGCDAATIRAADKSYVVISFDPKEGTIPFVIKVYHELAHIYCLDIQEREHPLDLQKVGDVVPGFLLWKEFIADYVALDALHHDLPRVSPSDQEVKDHIIALLSAVETTSGPHHQGALSYMANFFAFMLNLEGIDRHINRLKLPIKPTTAGRQLRRHITAAARTLYDRCQEESYMVVDTEFLDRLGYDAIEIQLYLEDYDDVFA